MSPRMTDYLQSACSLSQVRYSSSALLPFRSGRWTPENEDEGGVAVRPRWVAPLASADVESDLLVAAFVASVGVALMAAACTVAVLVAGRPRWLIPRRLRTSR
jgi:hypothetical protein